MSRNHHSKNHTHQHAEHIPTQPQQEQAVNELSYADFIKPLVTEIHKAVTTVLNDNQDKYTEFDIYNSLALTITAIASRSLPEDSRKIIQDQSVAIANAMSNAGFQQAQKDESYLQSVIIGAARATSTLTEFTEGLLMQNQQQETAVAEELVAPAPVQPDTKPKKTRNSKKNAK